MSVSTRSTSLCERTVSACLPSPTTIGSQPSIVSWSVTSAWFSGVSSATSTRKPGNVEGFRACAPLKAGDAGVRASPVEADGGCTCDAASCSASPYVSWYVSLYVSPQASSSNTSSCCSSFTARSIAALSARWLNAVTSNTPSPRTVLFSGPASVIHTTLADLHARNCAIASSPYSPVTIMNAGRFTRSQFRAASSDVTQVACHPCNASTSSN